MNMHGLYLVDFEQIIFEIITKHADRAGADRML
jgi:hypothetical protein